MNRLKDLREDKNIIQNDIPTYVLKKLAKFYNTSIDYLLYLTDERKPYPKSIVDIEKTSSK